MSRSISFSGLTWSVKSSGEGVAGPGPNRFSDDEENVFVDADGRLHLRITGGDAPRCAEVIGTASVGYGTYRFFVDSPLGDLDPNAVFGLFTWSDDPAFGHREIDIEFSRWGSPQSPNAQYVVQPSTDPANIHRFEMPNETSSTHVFTWQPGGVAFLSMRGHRVFASTRADVLQRWSAFWSIPVPDGETPRINLWLADGRPPANDVEIIVNRVEFEAI